MDAKTEISVVSTEILVKSARKVTSNFALQNNLRVESINK